MVRYKKVQSNGNNFLLLDNRGQIYSDVKLRDMTIRDCDIKKGIGADGMLVIEPSNDAEFKMRIINANGFESEMCGNGARCIAKYAYDHGIADKMMSFETLAGKIGAVVTDTRVKVTMGDYELPDQNVFVLDGVNYRFMTLGVPHVVVFEDENKPLSRAEMKQIGYRFDMNHDVFERGTNVNFVRKIGKDEIEVITYERGVEDITDSCGTGSCASAVMAASFYGMHSPISVQNIGGVNMVHFVQSASDVTVELEGHVGYSGSIECEDL
ncbi:MAG: diaminopimelate epimerase [Clostridiales bacterium 38-18]|nr:MAG: diaminopimelate epimerase [Clostridiales bacterium 38-18]